MEDIFLLPKAKAPVIFKVKTASALEFHILFFAFRRKCPADFTLCHFFLFSAQLLYNGTFGFPRGRQSLPKNIKLRMPRNRLSGVRLHEISWAVKRERAQTFS